MNNENYSRQNDRDAQRMAADKVPSPFTLIMANFWFTLKLVTYTGRNITRICKALFTLRLRSK